MKIFLYILTILLLWGVISFLNYIINCNHDKRMAIIDSIKIFLLVNLCNIMMFNSLYDFKNLINVKRQSYLYFLYYFLNGFIPGGIYIFIKYFSKKLFTIEKRSFKKSGTIAIFIVSMIIIFIGILGFSATAWERRVYYNATPDQIVITMLIPITGTDSKLTLSFIEGPLALSLAISLIIGLIVYFLLSNKFILKEELKHINEIFIRNVCLLVGIAIFISGLSYTFVGMELEKIVISYTKEDSFIGDNYVDPNDVKLTLNGKKRNLVHIYLESIENSFFDKDNNGIMEENLMPDLLRLYAEGDNFSHLSDGYGGPLKTYGGAFSVASMVNQVFGIPMRVPCRIGQYSQKDKFLPGAIGLGDILGSLGYNQSFLHGADARFAGLNNLYSDHGNFKIFDYNYAKKEGLIPLDYKANWGFEDEKLYEFAKSEMLRLDKLGEPFYIIVENADTHNPGFAFDGDMPIFGDSDKKEDYAKTIKFSQYHVYEFIRWIMAQDFYKDTTIVVIGDHNSMEPSIFKDGKDKGYTRTTYNLILNSAANKANSSFKNRLWANFDYMPTILASLGFTIEGDRLGLGTNLYSNKPTAYERLGYKEVNDRLVCNSRFYNEKFMGARSIYDKNNVIIK